MDNYHVKKAARGWVLVKEGAERPARMSGSKAELLKIVSKFMEDKTASVKIHKVDGSLAEERTYPRLVDAERRAG